MPSPGKKGEEGEEEQEEEVEEEWEWRKDLRTSEALAALQIQVSPRELRSALCHGAGKLSLLESSISRAESSSPQAMSSSSQSSSSLALLPAA